MEFVDRELTCVQCSKTFIFSSGEQQYFFDMIQQRSETLASNATL